MCSHATLFVAGIGSASVPVAGMSALLREFPPEKRGIALGWRRLGGAAGRHHRRGDAAPARPRRRCAAGDLIVAARSDGVHRGAVRAALAGRRRRDRRPAAGRRAVRAGHATGHGAGAALCVCSFSNADVHRAGRPRASTHGGPGGRAIRRSSTSPPPPRGWSGAGWRTATAAPAARGGRLAETGALAAGAALLMPLALRAGVVPAVIVACALVLRRLRVPTAYLYVTAGEIAGAERERAAPSASRRRSCSAAPRR